MIRRSKEPMAITEAELTSMTRELEDMHQATFPSVRATLGEFTDNLAHMATRARSSRRGVLLGVGGVAALGALAACGSDDKKKDTATPSASASGSPYTGDLKVVALAAALENLAVTAYDGALKRASDGKLGTVPPAIATFITTARAQHADHAAAWNGVLTKAKLPAIDGAPLTITQGAVDALGATDSVASVVKLALGLEEVAAQTYTFAAANVTDAGGIMTAATIQPVEQMHAAILHFVLGEYPVPLSFVPIDKAVKPDALTK
ncbi:ferritin-like domain-containing protein [Longispora sp. K20-0274]|uniref:ferritin-like domain-containing protein n=1 Tax=Longispora sp. K20-0274 TaxID=3088255 RepID=UPI00399C4107